MAYGKMSGATAKKIKAQRSPISGQLLDGTGERLIGGYSPEAFEKPLHFYQEYAHDWLLKRLFVDDEMGGGLFLDPGLGKTRITLTLIDSLFNLGIVKRVLVLAPLRPAYTVWPSEIKRWGFPQSHIVLHGQHEVGMSYNCDIEILNYAGLVKVKDMSKRWDMIVLDESTYIKTWQSKRSKKKLKRKRTTPLMNRAQYIRKMLPNISKRVILTGTPAANSLSDLHSQLYVVDDGDSLGRTVTQFRASYCYQGGWQGRNWMVLEDRKQAIHEAIGDRVLRMQAEDYLDMPKLIHNDIWVDMPKPAVKQYNKLKRELVAELSTGKVFAANASSAYIKCRQLATGQLYGTDEEGEKIPDKGSIAEFEYHVAHKEKINALTDLIEELAGKPLLVFYWFKHELAELKKHKEFKSAPTINGKTKTQDVERIIDEWNQDKHKVILCQWAAASHGLNMQKGSCSDIACLCLTDSAEGYEQAYRRIYRQGVSAPQVRIHRILTRGTVDEVQLERLNGKFETQSSFLNALKAHAKKSL